MEQLKALIIENDRSLPNEIEAFKKDNASMFSEFRAITHARFYPEDVKEALREGFNAIVGYSTFMYKDQLESTVMLLDQSPIKYKFFFDGALYHLNDFIETSSGWIRSASQFDDYKKFIEIIKKWVLNNQVFDIVPNDDLPMIKDRYHRMRGGDEMNRFQCKPSQIFYDEKLNIFYLDDEDQEYREKKVKDIHK